MNQSLEGEIRKVEQRKTDNGQKYHRIQVDNKWGSYWGNAKDLEIGDFVKAEYEDVKNGQFTNWKKFTPLDQEEEKQEKKQSSTQRPQKGKVYDAQRRFEIRKQVALKAAAKTAKDMTLAEVKRCYTAYVNLLSKQPHEFAMQDDNGDEQEEGQEQEEEE